MSGVCKPILTGLCALISIGAFGGALHIPCDRPFVFRAAAVNVVVLPYTTSVGQTEYDERISNTGEHLSLLVQMNTLASILKYPSVAAVQMVERHGGEHPPVCIVDRVWDGVTHPSPQYDPAFQISPGNAVVLASGRIFEDEGQIFVQTFIRFARVSAPEELSVTIGNQRFTGRFAAQAFAMPPQRLSRTDLDKIDELVRKNAQVRTAPRDDAPGIPTLGGIARCSGCTAEDAGPFSYRVAEVQGDWARVVSTEREGWMKLNTGFESGPLAAKLPELHFIDGVVGYLEKPVAKAAESADAALGRFLEAAGSASPVTAAVVAQELRAALFWRREDRDSAQRAVDLLGAASRLAPADGSVRNLQSVARLRLWQLGGATISQRETADAFLSASMLDSTRNTALVNLGEFYRLVLANEGPKTTDQLAAEEINPKLAYIERILEARTPHHE